MLCLLREKSVFRPLFGSLKTFRYQKQRSFCISGQLAIRRNRDTSESHGVQISALSVEQAHEIATKKIAGCDLDSENDQIFIGTGQYFHMVGRDRVFVLHSKDGFGQPMRKASTSEGQKIILDCNLASGDVDKLMDKLETATNCKLCNGEINSVDRGDWTFGFTMRHEFAIFSKNALSCCNLNGNKTLNLMVNGEEEVIPLTQVKNINVILSEEPWNEQAIEIELKNETFTQIVGYSLENDMRDLATLMVDTEWSVKAAALLCLKVRKLGYPVNLRLPRVLTVQGNPWVENRHEIWTKFSSSV